MGETSAVCLNMGAIQLHHAQQLSLIPARSNRFFPYGQLPKLHIAVNVLLLIHHPSLFNCHLLSYTHYVLSFVGALKSSL